MYRLLIGTREEVEANSIRDDDEAQQPGGSTRLNTANGRLLVDEVAERELKAAEERTAEIALEAQRKAEKRAENASADAPVVGFLIRHDGFTPGTPLVKTHLVDFLEKVREG